MTDSHDPSDLDALVARVDPERWLSSRFVGDACARADVIALYAFDYELARAPRVASSPLMGEIRLTWWREVLDEVFEGRPVRHHPTAQTVASVIRRHGLPRDKLESMVDARYRELDAQPMNLDEALTWAEGTGGAVASLCASLLDPHVDPAKACSAGKAWSIGMLIGTAGLTGNDARQALMAGLANAAGLSPEAFPAIAHATLARQRARAERPSALAARLRITWAVLRGRV